MWHFSGRPFGLTGDHPPTPGFALGDVLFSYGKVLGLNMASCQWSWSWDLNMHGQLPKNVISGYQWCQYVSVFGRSLVSQSFQSALMMFRLCSDSLSLPETILNPWRRLTSPGISGQTIGYKRSRNHRYHRYYLRDVSLFSWSNCGYHKDIQSWMP